MSGNKLTLRGVRENNLKNLDLSLDHDKLIVVTGISGSGKSTLAFDTIYAEGGRRYIETFSPYTRQFLDRLHQPDLDSVEGVRPALALEQRNRSTSSRSTVGTVTEINDYLKVLWPQLAEGICPKCAAPVKRFSPVDVCDETLKLITSDDITLAFTLPVNGEVNLESYREVIQSQGFVRFLDPKTGVVKRLSELTRDALEDNKLFIALDRVLNSRSEDTKSFRRRFLPSVLQAYHYGKGELVIFVSQSGKLIRKRFTESASCTTCGTVLPAPRPSMFSFNSPLGACKKCAGFGKVLEIDLDICIPDKSKSINEGAIQPWTSKKTKHELKDLKKFCAANEIDLDTPWRDIPEKKRNKILHGTEGKKGYYGVQGWFDWLKTKRHKMHVRVFLSRYRRESICPDCEGGRLQKDAFLFRIDGRTIFDAWNLTFEELLAWTDRLAEQYSSHEVVEIPLEEIRTRLRYLNMIGLSYLTLDRQTKTLSGGEFQRVNLTSILGSRLTNTTLVLDEPTIGLHPRDTDRLIEALDLLRSRGNTLVVVEHEPEVMLAADEILDLGPLAGEAGGEIIYQGSVREIASSKKSLTGKYLTGDLRIERVRRSKAKEDESKALLVYGANLHNLKDLDVRIPLEKFVVVTGVSGSGKSTLVHRCLYSGENIKKIEGRECIDELVLIDQSPIGKTPRSNSGTYTGCWDLVREVLAESPRAMELGLGKSAFSFNVDGGRCPACKGAGYERIEMQFLADVFVECEKCGGTRFQDTVLSVTVGGRNVKELLEMSLEECQKFFKELGDSKRSSKLNSLLQPMLDLGLGYLRLGQPLNEVSGGEAQRIKLASYLSPAKAGKYLFILDEPTTGLHPYNTQFLLRTFEELLLRGHSILCVEHNRDLIRAADWLIDLGPEGGEGGGQIVVQGVPDKLIKDKRAGEISKTVRELQRAEKSSFGSDRTRPRVRDQRRPEEGREAISIVGAKEHNLKNLNVDIPFGALTVITGVSGSGKSTLAFDILFQEGQRRYIDCLSPYARQYITHLSRADVDRVDHIPPTIAVSQKTAPPFGISTIATTTEIYQYLRLLFSKVGLQHCPDHGFPIQGLSKEEICREILEYSRDKKTFVFAPAVSGRKGYYSELFQRALRAEIQEARVDGKLIRIEEDLRLERHKLHWISLLVASFSEKERDGEMFSAAIEQALLWGGGTVEIAIGDKKSEVTVFSTERVCPKCKRGFRELDPQDFSFRSVRGVCSNCGGRGVLGKDDEGKDDESGEICPECDGGRIGEIGRSVTVGGKKIYDLAKLTAPALLVELNKIKFSNRLCPVVEPVLKELRSRLEVIQAVGLGYLSLDRDASTLSGGEAQRLRLARTLGSPLTGICYVLDEPTIGLHPKDHEKLMEILFSLRDAGNTVVVVEHDEETICLADNIIDVGPAGGTGGGHIVAQGTPANLLLSEQSQTGRALKERLTEAHKEKRTVSKDWKWLKLEGASANNLKNVDVDFPLGALTVICGVSGAGKSSLIHGSLVPAIFEEFEGKKFKKIRTFSNLLNHESLKRYLEVDQAPVGKTSSSCPASYLGIFDDIRKLYALNPESQARGWTASYFSFNSGKGKCPNCEGKGFLKVPMSFLPDAVSECEACNGLRYSEPTLEILYQGFSIGEVLKKTMSEAREIFANHKLIRRTLDYVNDLGIGYLTLGQPTHTLSGGEIQRLKLAKELGSREAVDTLYILDEPTIGLHMTDVDRLLKVMRQLIEKGNSVIVIEHNLDVIFAADHLIEVGPGPGDEGGRVVFKGTPEELRKKRAATPTRDALLSRSTQLLVKKLVKDSENLSHRGIEAHP